MLGLASSEGLGRTLGTSREETLCEPCQHQYEERDIQQECELHTGCAAKGATTEVAPPVDKAGKGEEDAQDWNEPRLTWREKRGQWQQADREPEQLFERVLHDPAVDLKPRTLPAQ